MRSYMHMGTNLWHSKLNDIFLFTTIAFEFAFWLFPFWTFQTFQFVRFKFDIFGGTKNSTELPMLCLLLRKSLNMQWTVSLKMTSEINHDFSVAKKNIWGMPSWRMVSSFSNTIIGNRQIHQSTSLSGIMESKNYHVFECFFSFRFSYRFWSATSFLMRQQPPID